MTGKTYLSRLVLEVFLGRLFVFFEVIGSCCLLSEIYIIE